MPDVAATILLLFSLLQIKHLFADYFLQTSRMITGREVYMHMGRAQHAGVHGLLSIPVFLVTDADYIFITVLVALEWVVHFHIDWAKAHYSTTHNLHPGQAQFWQAFGVDQALHQFTYVAMVWAWVGFAV